VTSFVDDPAFHTRSDSGLTLPAAARPVEIPADRVFSSLGRRQRQADKVDLALWVIEPSQEQADQLRAAMDAELFAASDGPGTGAWGLAVLGGAGALKSASSRRDDEEDAKRPRPPGE
jgi:hypothetical protein